jgi:hypothetical protein
MKAGKIHDINQANWWYGRMLNLIITFEPIPDDDYIDTYSGGSSVITTNKTGSSTIKPIGKLSFTPKLGQTQINIQRLLIDNST